jgi:hypothetical protein
VDSLGVLVATWSTLRPALVSTLIQRGPGTSGVYARFNATGSQLELLNPAGQVVRRLGAGAGLVAATAAPNATPTWLVTGTTAAGVAAAAAALTPSILDGHFALAVTGQTRLALPLEAGQ